MNKDDKVIGRRRTLQMFGVGLGAATGFLALAACKDKPADPGAGSSGAAAAAGCDTPPDDKSKQMRKTLQYKKEAADPNKKCQSCAQYDPGKFAECGACKLFGGPVQPNGGCLSWAPKGAEAGAPVPG